jgi:hypothetical protein
MFRFLRRKSPVDGPCSVCAGPARYGYSEHAETSLKDLRPMCLDCLTVQLRCDYRAFDGRAVVVQPTPGPPVYVFQPAAEWASSFPDSRITKDVTRLLEIMNPACGQCGSHARFLWIDSAGLTDRNFEDVLDIGISESLLQNNPQPVSLCPECCVARIAHALGANAISYLEVCSPRGRDLGFVLPMGY